jgi:hypothetical protein
MTTESRATKKRVYAASSSITGPVHVVAGDGGIVRWRIIRPHSFDFAERVVVAEGEGAPPVMNLNCEYALEWEEA